MGKEDGARIIFHTNGDNHNYNIIVGDNATLNFYGSSPKVEKKRNSRKSKGADKLCSEEAEVIWKKLYRAGIVDKRKQPIGLSLAEKGVLAKCIAKGLKLDKVPWKEFGELWGVDPGGLKSACDRGHDQTRTWRFMERVEEVINTDEVNSNQKTTKYEN